MNNMTASVYLIYEQQNSFSIFNQSFGGCEESSVYDKESGEGYKSVPLCHQNSDASQDALKLVPDSSF